jgi:putative serine protease PepD
MASTEPPVGTYLAAVLRDGITPFRYRSVARRLLGVSGDRDGIRPSKLTWQADFPHERHDRNLPTPDAGPPSILRAASSRATVPQRGDVDVAGGTPAVEAWDMAVPDPTVRPPTTTTTGRHDSPAPARATASSGPGRGPAGATSVPGSPASRPSAKGIAPAAETPLGRPAEPPTPSGVPTRGGHEVTISASATARPQDLVPPQAARLPPADAPSRAATAAETLISVAHESSAPNPPLAAREALYERAGRVVREPPTRVVTEPATPVVTEPATAVVTEPAARVVVKPAAAVAPVSRDRASALQQLEQLSQASHGGSTRHAPDPLASPPPQPAAATPSSPTPHVLQIATGATRAPAAYRARLHLGRIGLRGPR